MCYKFVTFRLLGLMADTVVKTLNTERLRKKPRIMYVDILKSLIVLKMISCNIIQNLRLYKIMNLNKCAGSFSFVRGRFIEGDEVKHFPAAASYPKAVHGFDFMAV